MHQAETVHPDHDGNFVMNVQGANAFAVDILTNNGTQGYEHWRRNGAPVAYFFEYLLGIRQTERSCGYSELVISPQAISKFGRMSGSMETPNGTVAVSYEKEQGKIFFRVSIPAGCKAVFRIDSFECDLLEGENRFSVSK